VVCSYIDAAWSWFQDVKAKKLFSHGICPECSDELYGKEDWYIEMKNEQNLKKE